MKKNFFVGIFLLLTFSGHTQVLSKTEKKILKNIDADMTATWQLLKESVNINSGTFNIAGVKKVGELYAKELAALGFTVEWIALPDSLKRAGHLVAFKKGTKGKKLFLIGHLDTVFEPAMPLNPFTILNDSTATGQGINDMKGGDVLVIAALKAMYKEGLLKNVNITVYFTGDEEKAGEPNSVSRADFIERARHHTVGLAFETAAGLNKVATARRGVSEWKLQAEGKQAHSSGVFGTSGYGAIYEAARIINTFREKLSQELYLTFNPGLFIGGSEIKYDDTSQKGSSSGKTNIISPQTVVIGDLRFLTEDQKQKTRENMQQIVSQHLPGTNASIIFKDNIPSMPPTAGNQNLVKDLSAISLALGYGEVKAGDPGSRGAGDISYVASYMDCLDGLGASGKGAHAPGETMNMYDYPKLIKRAAIMIYRLTSQ